MKAFHIFICLAVVAMLIWLNQISIANDAAAYGGLTWIGW